MHPQSPPGKKSSKGRPAGRPRIVLRIGVLGAARVLRRTWPAIHGAGHVVTLVGCRDPERGAALVEEVSRRLQRCVPPPPTGGKQVPFRTPAVVSYEAVVSSTDVDVVYITLPTAARDRWVRECIKHGKHVVGEKPAATCGPQLLEWLHGFAMNRLLYMDGTALSHSARVGEVKEQARALGPMRHIDVQCSFMASEDFLAKDIRVRSGLEPHGALGDLGWYCIRWILHLVDFALPNAVAARITECTVAPEVEAQASLSVSEPPRPDSRGDHAGHLTPSKSGKREHFIAPLSASLLGGSPAPVPGLVPHSAGVPPTIRLGDTIGSPYGAIIGFEATMQFVVEEAPVTATFYCSFTSGYEQSVHVYCAGGTVAVDGCINPTGDAPPQMTVAKQEWGAEAKHKLLVSRSSEQRATKDATPFAQSEQLWRDVEASLISLGKNEPILVIPEKGKEWSTVSYVTQIVMDKLLEAAKSVTALDDATAPGTSTASTAAA